MNGDIVSSLVPKSFELKNNPTQKRYGFIAQDVQKIAPELVHENENEMLSINYIDIIAHLVHHIQKQDERISELELKMKEMTKQ